MASLGSIRIRNMAKSTTATSFLEKAAESIGHNSETSTSIGDGIERLDLRIHANDANYANAVRLISKCPNLKSLHVDMHHGYDMHGEHECGDDQVRTSDGWHVLNQSTGSDPFRSVMANVNELAVVVRKDYMSSSSYFALRNDSPLLEFRALTSLELKSCTVNVIAWRQFLETTRNTLQIIRIINVGKAIEDLGNLVDDWILPFSMPRLTNFEYRGRYFIDKIIPAHLVECGALEHVHVHVYLDTDFNDVELEKLSAIQQSIKSVGITVVLQAWCLVHQTKAIIDKFFKQLGPNVKVLEKIGGDVDESIMAIDQCPNLKELGWHVIDKAGIEASRCLIKLFSDRERAEKLRKLRLCGHYDHSVLDALFENCSYLQKLSIQYCPQLIDRHLIDLATRCNALKKLVVWNCKNVGDDGLMAILIASGSHLEKLLAEWTKITDKTWMTMIDHCPNVVEISKISEELEEARRRKSFNRFVHVISY